MGNTGRSRETPLIFCQRMTPAGPRDPFLEGGRGGDTPLITRSGSTLPLSSRSEFAIVNTAISMCVVGLQTGNF